MLYGKEQKGPVSALTQVNGYLVSAIGQKVCCPWLFYCSLSEIQRGEHIPSLYWTGKRSGTSDKARGGREEGGKSQKHSSPRLVTRPRSSARPIGRPKIFAALNLAHTNYRLQKWHVIFICNVELQTAISTSSVTSLKVTIFRILKRCHAKISFLFV